MKKVLKVIQFLAVLYLFFLCIELMGGSFKLMGKDAARDLLSITDNPLIGLLIGILATSLMQSSSTTTSIVVGMVAAETLTISQAIPMVMGANIGTTITAAIISIGHIRLRAEFERAFTGATVHDFFNLCTVAILLPLEIFLHPIQRAATWMSSMLVGVEGATFSSPLKVIVKPVAELISGWGQQLIENKLIVGVLLVMLALGLLIFALARMVKIMRGAIAKRLEVLVDRYLFTSTFRALVVGAVVTAIVQSSSVTTSVVVPLLGTGIVRLEAAFPYMIGANIGTTVTAIMASLVTGNPAAVTIALAHLLFNLFGMAIFLPLRFIPLWMARTLGHETAKRRWIAPVWVVVVFFALPGLIIAIM